MGITRHERISQLLDFMACSVTEDLAEWRDAAVFLAPTAPLTNDDVEASTMADPISTEIATAISMYRDGASIPLVAEALGIPRSRVRGYLKDAGVLRSRADGIRLAAKQGRIGSGLRGKTREFSNEHCKNISKARLKWAAEKAAGVSLKPSGYLEFTRGPHKGRRVHVVQMEERLGRRLREDECVHHIDGDRLNNDDNNLALLTRSGHTRLHRLEDALSGNHRERDSHGRFR